MNRPIALGLAPNLERVDALAAARLLVSPRNVLLGDEDAKLAEWFRNFFSVSFAFPFVSARGALTALLLSQGIGRGDDVLLQAFTCVAVSNAVIATGARPIYVDITEDTFCMSFKDIQKKISPHTKAIIIQHTFGISGLSDELLHFAKEKKLFVIEDCAHTIGGTYKNKKLGTLGDGAVFSFGRDKAFSCVSGGIALTNNKTVGSFLEEYYAEQTYPSALWTFQQLFHSVSFFFLILPLYDLFLGKIVLVLLQKLHLLAKPVAKDELKHFADFSKKLPSVLSYLALLQLKRLDRFNTYREETASFYAQELSEKGAQHFADAPLLRYPLRVKNPTVMKAFAKKSGVLLGDWYSQVIDPKGTNWKSIYYTKGDCPNAEDIAEHIINLPTYPTLSRKDREKIVKIIKSYGES